jgi:hypothetical protein
MTDIIDKLDRAWDSESSSWGDVGSDTSWEEAHVPYTRQGFFQMTHGGGRRNMVVEGLVELGALLRKFADIMTIEMFRRDYGYVLFEFDRCVLDGSWIPARWDPYYERNGHHPRCLYTGSFGRIEDEPRYKVYNDDTQILMIDPDGDEDELQWNKIYINYRLVKLPVNNYMPQNFYYDTEYNRKMAEKLRLSEQENFFTFLSLLAENFGIYLKFEWRTSNVIKIKFISREKFVGEPCYIRSAITAKNKITYQRLSERSRYYGTGTYFTVEGYDAAGSTAQSSNYAQTMDVDTDEDDEGKRKKIMFTMSPNIFNTWWNGQWGFTDENYMYFNLPWVPVCMGSEGTGGYSDSNIINRSHAGWWALITTTAMFMRVHRNSDHPTANIEAYDYYTHIAALAININGVDYQFNKITDYLNHISDLDLEYFKVEKTIEVNGWCGFSPNADGSAPTWSALQIGSQISYDGVDYVVTEFERSMPECKVTITMQGVVRFDYGAGTSAGLILPRHNYMERDGIIDTVNQHTELVANGLCATGNVAVVSADNTVADATADENDYERLLGYFIDSYLTGETARIRTEGFMRLAQLAAQSTYCGQPVYLRRSTTSNVNYSLEQLLAGSEMEQLSAQIGTVLTGDTIKINFTNQYIFK